MKYLPLDKICNIVMGQAPPGSSYNSVGDGYPLVAGAGDFGENSPLINKFTTSPTRLSNPGDILLCIRATIGDTNWSDRQYCLGRGVAGLCPNPKLSDRLFVWHWLRSVKNLLKKNAKGSTFQQVSRGDIESLPFPDMGLTEQKRIAAILDKANAIRHKRQQALQLADEFLRSVFLDMFGDPVTNPKGWEVCSFGDIISLGPTNGLYKSSNYLGAGVLYLDIKGLYRGRIADFSNARRIEATENEIHRHGLKNGDVLINRVSKKPEGVGVAVYVNGLKETSVYESNMMRIRLKKKALPEFIVDYLGLPSVRGEVIKRSTIAAQASINQTGVKSVPIMLPSIEIQRRYVNFLQRFLENKYRMVKIEGEAVSLFNSLSQRAFSGEL